MLKNKRGFTLVELMVVIVVIGIIATIGGIKVQGSKKRAQYTRAITEMRAMSNAFDLYRAKYNDFPPDENRSVPAGLKEFVQDSIGSSWPDAPFPDGVYDYENWPADGYGPEDTYQISIRFCNIGANAVCKKNAQDYLKDYVDQAILDNWDAQSSMYLCFQGSCRSHQNKPISHPGYCINCGTGVKAF